MGNGSNAEVFFLISCRIQCCNMRVQLDAWLLLFFTRLTLIVPDEGYSRNTPFTLNYISMGFLLLYFIKLNTRWSLKVKVPWLLLCTRLTLTVHDDGYSRNTSCTLKLDIYFIFLLYQIKYKMIFKNESN